MAFQPEWKRQIAWNNKAAKLNIALKKPSALVQSCYQHPLLLPVPERRGLDERQQGMETSDTKERNLTGNELTDHCII